LGLFISFISGVLLVLAVVAWGWGRLYRDEGGAAHRVTKNSLVLIALSLLNKLIDMAFAMLMLRVLRPEGAGKYGFAIIFIGYFEILTRFGLGTLLTREVARDKTQGGRYLANAAVLRLALWAGSLPLMGLALALYWRLAGLSLDTAAAIGLFALALVPGGLADALSALFNAHEKMEYPAFVSTFTTLLKVSLGALVLLQGWGFVGLAGVSVASNLLSLAFLALFIRKAIGPLRPVYKPADSRQMLATSYPLMLNHLLATIFFRSDVLLLKPLAGDIQVGWYTAAYKFIDGLNVVPAYFTMALFPLVSRYAQEAKDSLRRAYAISLKLLFLLSLPIAVGTTFVAPQLIALLGGAEYLGESTLAL
ncbi:MAG: flippase, partial [Chloroflexota bacterium]|nr:flippase [Chloroflexota bacterium]